MIEAIKFRIKVCEKQVDHYENKKSELDSEKMWYKGVVSGLKGELETLHDLLNVALKSKELSESA